jgi:hypothetical protein
MSSGTGESGPRDLVRGESSFRVGTLLFAIAVLGSLSATLGCLPTAEPRYPQNVAAALARHPMRAVESEHVLLEYPESRRALAYRLLPHVEACAAYLERIAQVHNDVADRKLTVVMPEVPLNNAFVSGGGGGEELDAVVPSYDTSAEFALELGIPPSPAAIACHEITHHVHFLQMAGFAWFINQFGAVYSPQLGLDRWFDEGLAVYYETKLQPGIGRLAWPFGRATFAAGYAGRHIDGGALSELQRDFHGGNHYLVGSHFVRFLADRYGEDRLWKLVHVQARSILFPLLVNVRFWQAYDKSLSTLIDEFAEAMRTELVVRARPPAQRRLRAAGEVARYARAADGSEALLTADRDHPARLVLTRSAGRPELVLDLVDVLPPRRLRDAGIPDTSGLGFTADGRWLYFVAVDTDVVEPVARLVRVEVETGALSVVRRDLGGTGGSISPDGGHFAFARADGDHHDLAELDLPSGAVRLLEVEAPGTFVAEPRYSPDGRRLLTSFFDGQAFRLALFERASGRRLRVIATVPGPVHDAAWVDDTRIVYLGNGPDDVGFQVFLHELDTGANRRLTDAPYLAFEPRPVGASLRFLNREGWSWTVDEVALPAALAAPAPLASQASSPPAPPGVGGALPPAVAARPESPVAWLARPAETAETMRLSDRPYSSWERLFVPRLYGPTLAWVGRQDLSLGLLLLGNDRLSLHRWGIAGLYQVEGGGSPSFAAGYLNEQLAPLALRLTASQFRVHDTPPVPPGATPPSNPTYSLLRRDRSATVDAFRAFYDNPVDLGLSFLETYRPGDPSVLVPLRRFAGPHLSASFAGLEATPDSGIRRGLFLSFDVAPYPAAWNTLDTGFVDLRGEVATVLPLPVSRRHVLTFALRGRQLGGLPPGLPLLSVGGYGLLALLRRDANTAERPVYASPLLPPGVLFSEPLRGFEDHALYVNGVAIADLAYRYPLIVDWGSASTLGILPAFFWQQVDLELFGSAALTRATRIEDSFLYAPAPSRHLAVGAAVSLKAALGVVPLVLRYQLARRLTDDSGVVQLITLGS